MRSKGIGRRGFADRRGHAAPRRRPAVPRAPAQARGQRRFEAILDAAAAMIRDTGLEGLTVHGLAARAGTSIGSMYHFFPDLDAVIVALADRHLKAFAPLLSAVAERPAREWSRLSAAAVAGAIVTPFFTYLRSHPDILPLYAAPERTSRFEKWMEEMKRGALDIVERILAARGRPVPREILRARAAVVVGILEGTTALLIRSRANQARVVEELTRAMTAYLEALDRSH